MSSPKDVKHNILIKGNVKNEPIERTMDNQKDYLFVFGNMKSTNNQKLLNELIMGHPSTDKLLQYYGDRAQIYYNMERYQDAIDDINQMEYLGGIPDRMKVLKWKSIIHINFDMLREEVKGSVLLKGDPPCQMEFMQRISDANVTKSLEDIFIDLNYLFKEIVLDHGESCKRKRKEH